MSLALSVAFFIAVRCARVARRPSSRRARDRPRCARRAAAARRESLRRSARACSRAAVALRRGGVTGSTCSAVGGVESADLKLGVDDVHRVELAARRTSSMRSFDELARRCSAVGRSPMSVRLDRDRRDRRSGSSRAPCLPTTCSVDLDALAARAAAIARARFLDQIRVERAGESAVRGEQHDRRAS